MINQITYQTNQSYLVINYSNWTYVYERAIKNSHVIY